MILSNIFCVMQRIPLQFPVQIWTKQLRRSGKEVGSGVNVGQCDRGPYISFCAFSEMSEEEEGLI